MNILICCAGGMSSSFLVQKMREEVKRRQLLDIKVGSCAINQLNQYIKQTDVLLVAPQINFISSDFHDLNIKVFNITNEEYGLLEVEKLLNRVLNDEHEVEPKFNNKQNFKKIYDLLSPMAFRIAFNKSLEAISKSFTSIMPITMIGSIFVLLKNLPLNAYQSFITNLGLDYLFDLVSGATIDIISVYLVFFIAYNYVRSHDEHGHPAALLSLICFFIITGRSDNLYSLDYLGSKGIFGAIFIGLITGKLYLKLLPVGKGKLPTTIPKQVHRALRSIFPSLIIISCFTLIASLIRLTHYQNLHHLFYQVLQKTLASYLGNNILSYLFFQLAANILWFFGIHGGNIVHSLTNPVYIPLAIENTVLYYQGEMPINIISNCFAKCFTSGGVGSMFSLSILMTFFSKSEQYKTLGKISLPTTFFYINEPLLFGIPVIMNPLYFIPLMIITPLLGTLTYFVMKIGVVPIPRGFQLPWTTPPIIYGILQGGPRLALWEIICIFLAMIIWYPFFKKGDMEAYKKENNNCHN